MTPLSMSSFGNVTMGKLFAVYGCTVLKQKSSEANSQREARIFFPVFVALPANIAEEIALSYVFTTHIIPLRGQCE